MKEKPKPTKTAEEAAIEVLKAADQKRMKAAEIDLNVFLQSWGKIHNCSLAPAGSFVGNQMQSGLQIVLNPKK